MANIYCATASAPVIQNCTIEKGSGHGLVCADAALPTVVGNTFQHNSAHPISIFANYVPLVDTSNIYMDNVENAIELKGDNITSTVTWPDLGIPYALAGDVSVFKPALGDTLTLEPGVTVAFDPLVQLRVGGSGFPGTLVAAVLTWGVYLLAARRLILFGRRRFAARAALPRLLTSGLACRGPAPGANPEGLRFNQPVACRKSDDRLRYRRNQRHSAAVPTP